MEQLPKHALVLFDADGYTCMLLTKKLRSDTVLVPGVTCIFYHCKTEFQVEILKLSDYKADLNVFEEEWVKTNRALAIEKAMKDQKRHGFLKIGIQEVSAPSQQRQTPAPLLTRKTSAPRKVRQTPAAQKQQSVQDQPILESRSHEPSQTTTSTRDVISGSNGREINVLYAGAGETSLNIASPNRTHNCVQGLTGDQADVIQARVEEFANNKCSVGSQTDPILIFKDKDQLLESYDPKGKTIQDIHTILQSHDATLKAVTAAVAVLPEILGLIKKIGEDREISRILRDGLLDFSTPYKISEGCQTESMPENEVPIEQDNYVAIPVEAIPVEAVPVNIPVEAIPVEAVPVNIPVEAVPVEDIPVEVNYQDPQNENEASPVEDSDHVKFIQNAVIIPVSEDQPSVNILQERSSKCYSNTVRCYSGPIIEIVSAMDMVSIPGDAEVRVSQQVQQQLKTHKSWPGNFGWQLTQKLYTKDELSNRNYYGTNGKDPLSPRRKHAIEHALISTFQDDVSVIKDAVNGINTGLRNMKRRRAFPGTRRLLFRVPYHHLLNQENM